MYVGCVNHKGMDCEQAYIAPKSWIIKWDENINHCTDKRTFIYSNKLKASKQGTDTRQSGHRGDGVFCRRGGGGGIAYMVSLMPKNITMHLLYITAALKTPNVSTSITHKLNYIHVHSHGRRKPYGIHDQLKCPICHWFQYLKLF